MKLLYITCSNKDVLNSTSKRAGLGFINKINHDNKYEVEHIDLFNTELPKLNSKILTDRATIESNEMLLSNREKNDLKIINDNINSFLEADLYVIAYPMWSMNMPYVLKQYIDSIIVNGKTVNITEEDVTGLLDDKHRQMVIIQSSGGKYPKILNRFMNHGITYLKDIFTFLGIKDIETIYVEGIESESAKEEAIYKSIIDSDKVIHKLENRF